MHEFCESNYHFFIILLRPVAENHLTCLPCLKEKIVLTDMITFSFPILAFKHFVLYYKM